MDMQANDVELVNRKARASLTTLRTRKALSENLFSACQVADSKNENNITSFSEVALSKESGIARSTIQKVLKGNKNKKPYNPDLETISRLAATFNIPPAFLLMSSEDWKRLIFAINDMQNIVQTDRILCQSIQLDIETNKVNAGLSLIKKLGTYPNKIKLEADENLSESALKELTDEIHTNNEIKKQSIICMTAIAQNFANTIAATSSENSKKQYLATLTTLAAIFGASIQTN